MKQRIFTGNYDECKVGNLISISGDRGKRAGFVRKSNTTISSKKGILEYMA